MGPSRLLVAGFQEPHPCAPEVNSDRERTLGVHAGLPASWSHGSHGALIQQTAVGRVIIRSAEHFQGAHLGGRRGWAENELLSPHPGAGPCLTQLSAQRSY